MFGSKLESASASVNDPRSYQIGKRHSSEW